MNSFAIQTQARLIKSLIQLRASERTILKKLNLQYRSRLVLSKQVTDKKLNPRGMASQMVNMVLNNIEILKLIR